MESRGISWKSRAVAIKVGFLLESASYNDKVLESNDKVEFL